jgi:hypothetical protein
VGAESSGSNGEKKEKTMYHKTARGKALRVQRALWVILRTIVIATVCLMMPRPATGATITFNSEAAFVAAAPGSAVESFETTPFQPFPGFTASGVILAPTSGILGLHQSTRFPTDGFPSLAVVGLFTSARLYLAFDSPINAFGFNVRDIADIGAAGLTLTTDAGDFASIVSTPVPLGPGNTIEFGLINQTASFTKVIFSYDGGGPFGFDEFYIDEVRFGTVGSGPGAAPLPPAIAMGIVIVAALGLARFAGSSLFKIHAASR